VEVPAGGYVPAYVGPIRLQASFSNASFVMMTLADMTALGVAGSNGLLASTLRDQAGTPISGATIVLTSKYNATYSVLYNGGGSSTNATGKFAVPNVQPGDVVKVDVISAGYTFAPVYMDCFGGAITEITIWGVNQPGAGSSVYANYGAAGLWQWNGTAWSQINAGVPASMVAAGSMLYEDNGAAGLWQWNGTAWSRINTAAPASMLAAGSMLYANYGAAGLWQWSGTAWSQINTGIPASMITGF
jgi:hypothetical protein